MKTKIVFYQTNNICGGMKSEFGVGEYQASHITFKGPPQLAKLEPNTTLVINDSERLYNNPYSDRFVVVKLDLDQNPIKSFKVADYQFQHKERQLQQNQRKDSYCDSGMFSSFDAILVVVMISLLWMWYYM